MPASDAIGRLAEFVAAAVRTDIPDPVFERGRDCVLDVLGAAGAGAVTGPPDAMYRAMRPMIGHGESSIWFKGKRGAPPAVATVNAMSATVLDIDDGHRMAAGHPGAAIVAAAAAAAEDCGATFEDFLVAVVLGYEVAVAVAMSRISHLHLSTVSGRWSGVGAAAAAARICGVDAGTVRHALLIAEQHAPRLAAAQLHGFAGADVKEGIAWSVLTGVTAARLAAEGFTGYPDTFEGMLYSADGLTENLGKYQAISGLFFKPYACCRWIHAALDGVCAIMQDEGIAAADVDEINIWTFRNAARLGNQVAPVSVLQAQFSIPFCVAAMAECGPSAFCPMDGSLLSNRRVRQVSQRVRIREDQELEEMFPAYTPAIVQVTSRRLTFERRVDTPWGDPTNPMTRPDIVAKFCSLTASALERERIDLLCQTVFKSGAAVAAGDVFDLAAAPGAGADHMRC